MQPSRTEVLDRAAMFVTALAAMYAAVYAEKYPVLLPPKFHIDPGGVKYLRIVTTQQYDKAGVVIDGQRSVYCFIDANTGDILKAAGWKAPAKGARGSIFNENCDVGVKATMHGSGLYL